MLIDSAPRWRGYKSLRRAFALTSIRPLIVQLPDSLDPNSSFESGHRYTESLLDQKKKFTAVMAFDDLTALGAIRALTKAGVKVPSMFGYRV